MKNIAAYFHLMTTQLLFSSRYIISLKHRATLDAARAFLIKAVLDKLFPGYVTFDHKEPTHQHNELHRQHKSTTQQHDWSVKEFIITDSVPRKYPLFALFSPVINQRNMTNTIKKIQHSRFWRTTAIIALCIFILSCLYLVATNIHTTSFINAFNWLFAVSYPLPNWYIVISGVALVFCFIKVLDILQLKSDLDDVTVSLVKWWPVEPGSIPSDVSVSFRYLEKKLHLRKGSINVELMDMIASRKGFKRKFGGHTSAIYEYDFS